MNQNVKTGKCPGVSYSYIFLIKKWWSGIRFKIKTLESPLSWHWSSRRGGDWVAGNSCWVAEHSGLNRGWRWHKFICHWKCQHRSYFIHLGSTKFHCKIYRHNHGVDYVISFISILRISNWCHLLLHCAMRGMRTLCIRFMSLTLHWPEMHSGESEGGRVVPLMSLVNSQKRAGHGTVWLRFY